MTSLFPSIAPACWYSVNGSGHIGPGRVGSVGSSRVRSGRAWENLDVALVLVVRTEANRTIVYDCLVSGKGVAHSPSLGRCVVVGIDCYAEYGQYRATIILLVRSFLGLGCSDAVLVVVVYGAIRIQAKGWRRDRARERREVPTVCGRRQRHLAVVRRSVVVASHHVSSAHQARLAQEQHPL